MRAGFVRVGLECRDALHDDRTHEAAMLAPDAVVGSCPSGCFDLSRSTHEDSGSLQKLTREGVARIGRC
jgi:hypothetical protein